MEHPIGGLGLLNLTLGQEHPITDPAVIYRESGLGLRHLADPNGLSGVSADGRCEQETPATGP